jgi:hypothetical protein
MSSEPMCSRSQPVWDGLADNEAQELTERKGGRERS